MKFTAPQRPKKQMAVDKGQDQLCSNNTITPLPPLLRNRNASRATKWAAESVNPISSHLLSHSNGIDLYPKNFDLKKKTYFFFNSTVQNKNMIVSENTYLNQVLLGFEAQSSVPSKRRVG